MGSGNSHLYNGTNGSKPNLLIPSAGVNVTGTKAGIGTGGVGGSFAPEDFSIVLKPGDMVILIREFHNMPIGTIGKILSQQDRTHYKIRFYDKQQHYIGVYVTPRSFFRFLK